VLRGEVAVRLRESVLASATRAPRGAKGASGRSTAKPAPLDLDHEAQARYSALKAWRAEVAREHNLPAYVIFHDATLAAIAQRHPLSLEDLQGISGMGEKKLQAYGDEVLHVSSSA
jgi:ATP-dependent DNA helicase RecQ